jgi:endonuclease III
VNKANKAEFFRRLAQGDPTPRTELHYATHFQLLVAVMLSAQATDVSVNKATATLYQVAPDARTMLALGVAGVKAHIRTIGLFNTKAENVIKTCRILLENYAGDVPRERAALEALPGVGRKTANVVLNVAFGEPTIAVDTHIFRIGNRTRLAPGKTPLVVEQGLLRAVPPAYQQHAHHWLILHGRYVCTARNPHCGQCVVVDICEWRDKRKHLET